MEYLRSLFKIYNGQEKSCPTTGDDSKNIYMDARCRKRSSMEEIVKEANIECKNVYVIQDGAYETDEYEYEPPWVDLPELPIERRYWSSEED